MNCSLQRGNLAYIWEARENTLWSPEYSVMFSPTIGTDLLCDREPVPSLVKHTHTHTHTLIGYKVFTKVWDTSELNHLVIIKELSNLCSALPIQSWRMACFGENGLLWCQNAFDISVTPANHPLKKKNKQTKKRGWGQNKAITQSLPEATTAVQNYIKIVFIVSIFRVIFYLWQVILVFPLTGSDKNFHLKIIESAKNKNNKNRSILRRTH